MFVPPGIKTQSLITPQGQIVYYTNEGVLQPPAPNPEALVFLHALGGGSSAYEWSKVYPAFTADYKILAPDLVGWGRSEHPAKDYHPEDYVQMIVSFIQQTCNSPVTVIASGLTAAFTLRAAVESPEYFKSLILVSAAGLNDFGRNYSANPFAQFIKTPIIDRLLYSTGIATPLGIRVFLEQQQFGSRDRVYSEIIEAYLQSAQQENAEYAALSFVRGDLSFDLSQYVPRLKVPSVLIWGRKSSYVGPDLGRRYMELNPTAIQGCEVVHEARLTPHLELPALFIGMVRKYLPMPEARTEKELEVIAI
jgi:pimeloyl-ACP methyl ester carboxylesterase